MNMDTSNSNSTAFKRIIQQDTSKSNSTAFKRLFTMIKWDSFLGCRAGSTFSSQSMWYITLIIEKERKRKRKKIKKKKKRKGPYDPVIRCRKSIRQNSASFLNTNHRKSWDRRNILKLHKSHLWKALSWYHSQWGNTESSPPGIRNTTQMFTLTAVVQHSVGSCSISNQTTKGNQRHQNWQRRSQAFTFCKWHYILHGKPRDSIKSLLELIHEFNKAAGYIINVQKSVAL